MRWKEFGDWVRVRAIRICVEFSRDAVVMIRMYPLLWITTPKSKYIGNPRLKKVVQASSDTPSSIRTACHPSNHRNVMRLHNQIRTWHYEFKGSRMGCGIFYFANLLSIPLKAVVDLYDDLRRWTVVCITGKMCP